METKKPWRLLLFGQPRIQGEGQTIEHFATRRSALLLSRLALARGQTLSRAAVADVLWPEDYYDATRIRLRQELSRLRKSLGDARDVLETDDHCIRLNGDLISIDVREFELLFRSSQQLPGEEKRKALRETVRISSETFAIGESEPWIEIERNRLRLMRYAALTELAHEVARLGDFEQALNLARQAIAVDPLQEDAHVLAMQALGNLGFLADALSQYQELRRLLKEHESAPSEKAERVAASLQSMSGGQSFSFVGSGHSTFVLPAPLEPIIGREEELAKIVPLLDPGTGSSRLVTLLGAGGIGKTRLALESGAHLQEAFRQNVGFVSLADLQDASQISSATLLGLFLERNQSLDPLAQIIEMLPAEPMLLILDNIEHLTAGAGLVIRQMLESKGNLRILCTSRQALNISGETIFRVGPLAVPHEKDSFEQAMSMPAVRMFLEAAHADSLFTSYKQDSEAIIEIARKLEGIPLAIQLAAARLKTVTANELLIQLDKKLTLLVNRMRNAPERHRTLARAISETFEGLDLSMQGVFLKLAVFRGGWSRASAETVCGLENCLEAMEILLDASLIQVVEEGREIRFRMLETLREFALSELSEDEKLMLQHSHAHWILNMASRASSHYATRDSLEVFRTLELERDNIREACHFALQHDLDLAVELGAALGSFWFHRGIGVEALKFYGELFARLGGGEVTQRVVEASLANASIAHNIEDPSREQLIDRTIALAHAKGMVREEALAKSLKSICLLRLPDRTESESLAAESLALISPDGSPMEIANAKRALAILLAHDGSPECLDIGRELVETSIAKGAVYFELRSKQFLAFASLIFSEIELAEKTVAGLLELANEIGAVYQVPNIQEALGLIAMERGDYAQALEHLKASAGNWRERRVMDQHADLNKSIGLCLIKLGDLDAAAIHVRYALQYWHSVENLSQLHYCLEVSALLWLEKGDLTRAGQIFSASQAAIARKGMARQKHHTKFSESLSSRLGRAVDAIEPCLLEQAIELALEERALPS